MSSRLAVIVEVIGSDDPLDTEQLESRASEGAAATASVAPMPQIIANKSRLASELIGASWNCVMTGVSAVGMVVGVAGEVPSGGTSSFLVVAAWVGIGANALQCGNGIVRVTEALQNPTSNSLQSWDDDSIYSTMFLLVDALGVFSGVASLPAAWRNFWAVISRQRAFVARGLSLEKLKAMNRFARFKVIREVFEEAAKTPEGRTALQRAAAEAKVSATSFARETMSVRQSMTMVKVISKETQRRLINSLVGVLAPLTGTGASATPSRWSGSASGSVNWVINLVDSG